MTPSTDESFMARALALAERAYQLGEVPVGALLVRAGDVIGEGWNKPIVGHDPTAHAEIMALRSAAGQQANYRLPGSTMYVTIEPCTMCVGAMMHARIERVVFGATEPKAGALVSRAQLHLADYWNHQFSEVKGGVLADVCADRIRQFFAERREMKKGSKS